MLRPILLYIILLGWGTQKKLNYNLYEIIKINTLPHLHYPQRKLIKAPSVGIEPTTTRLRVVRSTDWARKALQHQGSAWLSLPLVLALGFSRAKCGTCFGFWWNWSATPTSGALFFIIVVISPCVLLPWSWIKRFGTVRNCSTIYYFHYFFSIWVPHPLDL